MWRTGALAPGWGVTVVRVTVAVILIAAGWQKAGDIAAVASGFARLGIPAPGVAAPLVVGLEVVGGALLLVGLLSRWVALAVAFQFVVATFYVKWAAQGFGAARLDLVILTAAILVILDGPGRAAIDNVWLERTRNETGPARDAYHRRRSA
jgi:putative oxidoreductase